MSNFNLTNEFQNRTPLNNKNSKSLNSNNNHILSNKNNTPFNNNNIKDKLQEVRIPITFDNIDTLNNYNNNKPEKNEINKETNYSLIKEKYRFSVDQQKEEDFIDEDDEKEFYYNINKNCEEDNNIFLEEVIEFNGFAPINLNIEDKQDEYQYEEEGEYVKKAKDYLKNNEFIYISDFEDKANKRYFEDNKLQFDFMEF